jgi:hypothetical protein
LKRVINSFMYDYFSEITDALPVATENSIVLFFAFNTSEESRKSKYIFIYIPSNGVWTPPENQRMFPPPQDAGRST